MKADTVIRPRHGHLMLFDDDEQLEVRHVVSLGHHDISLYAGEEPTAEGELFIKRNAICLSRRPDASELRPESQLSKPFFLFSENCSAKEDFYFALLRNQELGIGSQDKPPSPLQFDVKNIISLVQKLHSSEEHMQTRWLNGMIGRIFLGIHKTKELEDYVREKLEKKMSRVKKPTFLSNIAIRNIDTGESAPFITNPRLRDLTIEGECGVELDVKYTGNFRLEVAATARIDLGTRFKVREVNLVLAVVLRKLEGHMLFKIKPPPSNRMWFSFQQMPKMDMTIEPIVSSRQITYTVILRQIENRIKEVVAETLVLPFWDDVAFFRTQGKKWRGGIFEDNRTAEPTSEAEGTAFVDAVIGQNDDNEDTDRFGDDHSQHEVKQDFELAPVRAEHEKERTGLFGRRLPQKKKSDISVSSAPFASSSSVDTGSITPSIPRTARSASLVNPPTPTTGTDATNAQLFKPSTSPSNKSPAINAMATLSAQSRVASSASSPGGESIPHSTASPFQPYVTTKPANDSSSSSREATDTEKEVEATTQSSSQRRRGTASTVASSGEGTRATSPSLSTRGSVSQNGRGLFARKEGTKMGSSTPGSPGVQDQQKRTALAAVSNAAASARRWGLNALQRHNEAVQARSSGTLPGDMDSTLDLNQPIGRGRPLPPPGQPLPLPERRKKTALTPVPRRDPILAPPQLPPREKSTASEAQPIGRRPVPPPPLPERSDAIDDLRGEGELSPRAELPRTVPPPPLPLRRQTTDGPETKADHGEGVLVVKAPAEDEGSSPSSATHSAENWQGDKEPEHERNREREQVAEHTGENTVKHTEEAGPMADDEDEFSAWMDNPGPEEAGSSPTV